MNARRGSLAAGSGLVALVLVILFVLPHVGASHTGSRHWETPLPVVLLGLIQGITYGLLGVGLVLIYRSNRIINFAHGQTGAFAAAFFGIEVVRWHLPYWLALAPALALAAATGATAEAAVIRRLRRAPAVMSIVATLGFGQFLVLFAFAINKQAGAGGVYPQPPGLPTFRIGALLITRAYFGMLVLSPLVVLAVGLLLKYGRYGLAIRAAAANPEAAWLGGISASRMSTLSWSLAGALAAFTAILTQPTQGFTSSDSFGPHLLLLALTAAVVARMSSLPAAFGAGAALGVIEQLLLWNYPQSGLVEVVLFGIILVAMLLQRQRVSGRAEDKGSWAVAAGFRPIPQQMRRVWAIRHLGHLVAGVTLLVLLVLPAVITNTASVSMTGLFGFAIVGLSVGIVTGLGGQLSLGQFALAGIGAVVSWQVARRTGNFVESFVYAGLAAAAASVIIGIPALRIKGLLLTVTTLAFALVVPAWLLQQSWMLGGGQQPGRPIVAHHALVSGRAYYFVGLATLVAALAIARNVRAGGLGRLLVAVRDNEDAARSFTVPAARVKLQGFALAGFVAGIGGAMYGHSLSFIGITTFPTQSSIDVVKLAVIGGIGTLTGPLLGALVVRGATFLPLDSAGLATTAAGQLIILMYLPGGLAQLVAPLRDRVTARIARRAGIDVGAAWAAERGFDGPQGAGSASASPSAGPTSADLPTVVELPAATSKGLGPVAVMPGARARYRVRPGFLLEATGLSKSFGGVHAVRDLGLQVRAGETLGLIGPNGAGKTTTFELLAGFTRADTGRVVFDGRDVTALGPQPRGRLGLIRSFQDAALFPTLTVSECVQLALERTDPTQFLPAIVGLTGQERRKKRRADALIAWMGLDRYRASEIRELSTGTRRIAEIACLIALQPKLLLLDEPSSGIAQRETEALQLLLSRLKEKLSLTLVIIEHDIPMIMALSDRIVCMADGAVLAEGPPEVVRTNPRVIEAYLGGSPTAIERSGRRSALIESRRRT
ncbi:MAG: ABC transporter permease subunit [Acidimicrobiales bacterium]